MNTNKIIKVRQVKVGDTVCLIGNVRHLVPLIMMGIHDTHADKQRKKQPEPIGLGNLSPVLFDLSPAEIKGLSNALTTSTMTIEPMSFEPVRPLVTLTGDRPAPLGGYKFGQMILTGGTNPKSNVTPFCHGSNTDAMKVAQREACQSTPHKENNIVALFGQKETTT